MTEQETTPPQPAPEEYLKADVSPPETLEENSSADTEEEEIDLNQVFPEEDADLNELFPDKEMRTLL